MSNADEDDFLTPQNRPDQYGAANSGIGDCSSEDNEEWENINPQLRPGPVKWQHGVNVHTDYNAVKSNSPTFTEREKGRSEGPSKCTATRETPNST